VDEALFLSKWRNSDGRGEKKEADGRNANEMCCNINLPRRGEGEHQMVEEKEGGRDRAAGW